MRKILKNTIISMLIIALMATLSGADWFSSKEMDEAWRQEIDSWEVKGFLLVKNTGSDAYLINKDVEIKTKTIKSGNFFNKKTITAVFYVGDLLWLYNPRDYGPDYNQGIKYRIAKCVVPESENKCYWIKVTAYNIKDVPVKASPEEDLKNLDWSNITEAQPNTVEYAYITAIREFGRSK